MLSSDSYDENCPLCSSEETVRHYQNGEPDKFTCRECSTTWVAELQSLPGVDWSQV